MSLDLTPFKQHILTFLTSKQVEPQTIAHTHAIITPMSDEHLFLFCEFSFILKRRECDPVKKTGEHAIRDHLQTFWHDENRLVKDLRYADYIHYFTKYNRCHELFDFFKLCTEHGNRKRPLSFAVKLQEFLATPIETLRSRSDRKNKPIGTKKTITPRRTSGTKRIKQEEINTPCDLEYIPSIKKMRKHESMPITTIVENPPVDLFATEFTIPPTFDEQWSPVSHSSVEEMYGTPSTSSPHSPHIDSPISYVEYEQQPTTQVPYPIPSYLQTNYHQPIQSAAPTWTRQPSIELCASDSTVDWDAIATDLNKTYQPIVESYYQSLSTYPSVSHQGWYQPQINTNY